MAYRYATQNMTENMVKAVRLSMQISTKVSVEIGSRIKGKSPAEAIKMLESVVEMKRPMPYSRFNWNVGHKPGHTGPGRYPVAASTAFIALIKSVVANAVNQSLDEKKLIIVSVVAQKGAKTYKYSRVRGLKAKNTHVEIVVQQVEPKVRTPRVKQTAQTRQEAAAKAAATSQKQ